MKRQVSYQRRLREKMATAGMFTTSELAPPLAESGINLSLSQVHRLVPATPERLSLPVLAALCDIFDCTPADLIATRAENATVRRVATGNAVVDLSAVRPKYARIRPEG
ncbi:MULTISPECIES: helix-turn-helix domain-containing protein [unclassified Streptomyces]|uniref:helix-turn-helix domain-containing protein n=1 Tax=unclassified Streptomyces TaxID=2593676 RepID=UPI002442BC1E|nr:helix-turn-helix transcriptional regulator [Streptomyces sp. DH41]MDG9728751.1 helix-turn-helix transcriptional regulator [Streptomyces sp. DH41]